MVRLDVRGPTTAHKRPATLTSFDRWTIQGVADNDYAPRAIVFSDRIGVTESFRIERDRATYYLLLTWDLPGQIDTATVEMDVPVSRGRLEVNRRGEKQAMATPYVAGQCKLIGETARG